MKKLEKLLRSEKELSLKEFSKMSTDKLKEHLCGLESEMRYYDTIEDYTPTLLYYVTKQDIELINSMI